MNKEDLIYKDKDYEIYKKHLDVSGNMMSGLDLMDIAINSIKKTRPFDLLQKNEDKLKVIFGIHKKFLKAIENQVDIF